MPDTEIAAVVLVAGRRTEKLRVYCASVLVCDGKCVLYYITLVLKPLNHYRCLFHRKMIRNNISSRPL